jgi:transcription elongation GreA/GreB family factor
VLYFGSAAGGETTVVGGVEITMITSRAPLGMAMLGKAVGDSFEITMGNAIQTFVVRSVE